MSLSEQLMQEALVPELWQVPEVQSCEVPGCAPSMPLFQSRQPSLLLSEQTWRVRVLLQRLAPEVVQLFEFVGQGGEVTQSPPEQ